MNSITLASLECANYSRHHKEGHCALAKKKRCAYFEESVLLLSRYRPDKFPGVIDHYLKLHPEVNLDRDGDAEIRPCPDCGEPLLPRKQVCFACAKKRRKASTSAAMTRSRSHVSNLAKMTP